MLFFKSRSSSFLCKTNYEQKTHCWAGYHLTREVQKDVKEKGFQAHVVVVRAFYLVEERYKYWRACVYCTSTDNIVRPEIRDQSQ